MSSNITTSSGERAEAPFNNIPTASPGHNIRVDGFEMDEFLQLNTNVDDHCKFYICICEIENSV
jgi:hypothetical protein